MQDENLDAATEVKKFASIVKKMISVIGYRNQHKSLPGDVKTTLLVAMHQNITSLYFSSAYIITNASMMIWSIIYHSWLGFLLLVWANCIWVRSNQRSFMLKSSPLLTIYTTGLLITDYIYNMAFTEGELPSEVNHVNMKQIGLIRYESLPGLHLLVKSTLMVTFWLTMRQMLQEKLIDRHRKTLKFEENLMKMVADGKLQKSSVSKIVKEFCVFGLMWIIMLVLFVMAVYGKQQMNFFRLTNMCFVLFFMIMFQVSHKNWIKMMLPFWWILIIYTMGALILIYSYQFDDFPTFELQQEIGLIKHPTMMLFKKLLSFTLVILLTGLQINHFHSEFCNRVGKKIAESENKEEDTGTKQEDKDVIKVRIQHLE